MSIIKNFPSAADLDLDMWQAATSPVNRQMGAKRTVPTRRIHNGDLDIALLFHTGAESDAAARRIEMLGDLYDTLRELADRARTAGLDISQAQRVMTEFVAPKPFSGTGDENEEG